MIVLKRIDLEGHLSTDFKWHLVLSQETTHECLCKSYKTLSVL